MTRVRLLNGVSVMFGALLFLLSSCQKSEDKKGDNEHVTWAEEEAFHVVIAETFHPMDNDSNFVPIRTRSSQLVDAAERWLNSTPPMELKDPDTFTEILKELVAQSQKVKALSELEGNDDSLRAELTVLHDLFHKAGDAAAPNSGHQHDHKH